MKIASELQEVKVVNLSGDFDPKFFKKKKLPRNLGSK